MLSSGWTLQAIEPQWKGISHHENQDRIEERAQRDAGADPSRDGVQRGCAEFSRRRAAGAHGASAERRSQARQRQKQCKLEGRGDVVDQLKRRKVETQSKGGEQAENRRTPHDGEDSQDQAHGEKKRSLFRRESFDGSSEPQSPSPHGCISPRW